jgi:hypothetical protein
MFCKVYQPTGNTHSCMCVCGYGYVFIYVPTVKINQNTWIYIYERAYSLSFSFVHVLNLFLTYIPRAPVKPYKTNWIWILCDKAGLRLKKWATFSFTPFLKGGQAAEIYVEFAKVFCFYLALIFEEWPRFWPVWAVGPAQQWLPL